MHQQHHDACDEQNVNKAGGNVKCEETKQPKNNQNRGDESKHVFISFSYAANRSASCRTHRTEAPFLVGFVLLGIRLPD
jgi:hypothetical protein